MAQGDIIDTMLSWLMELLTWVVKTIFKIAVWLVNTLVTAVTSAAKSTNNGNQ